MTGISSIKNKLRYFLVHVPRVSLDILRTEGVRPLVDKAGRFIRQTYCAMTGREYRPKPGIRAHARSGTREDYFNYLVETTAVGSRYVPISYLALPQTDIRLVAFYLPQFHPIPENDEWWGKGFTEWTNVTRAVPQFVGHYQPRLPGELGFYDLRLGEVQRRQVELAKQYGLHGFCFHFYWFGGKRLLEMPLERFVSDDKIDFPFCISWANENWSRTWAGLDSEVLIGQEHSPDDDLAFIEHVSRYLKDERYIRIGSKPLLIVYRPALLPEPARTAERWREWCRENGIGEIYLALTHAFEHVDPREVGFDAAIEFAPNTFPLKDVSHRFDIVNSGFEGRIFDYHSAIDLAKSFAKPPFTKFRSLCPGWDNDARRPGRGNTLVNSTPAAYGDWLRFLCDFTTENFSKDERLIFINAWNEWAEGAYLEPDRKYGYAYLEATADVLSVMSRAMSPPSVRWKVLFVSHDAGGAGAQSVFLGIISWFRNHTHIDFRILCLKGGPRLELFKALGETLVLEELRKAGATEDELVQTLKEFCGGGPDLVYCNTMAAGQGYRLLSRLGAPIIAHVHELEMSIRHYAADWAGDVFAQSVHFIACSGAVRDNLIENHGVDPSKITVAYSGIEPGCKARPTDEYEKRALRKRLGIKEDVFVVFGCGLGMPYRKGADLFIETARVLRNKGANGFHFYWVGNFDPGETNEAYGAWSGCLNKMKKDGVDSCVTFLGIKDDPREFFAAGDAFLLTSREEPLGIVALEAADCGLPVMCFEGGGGLSEFVSNDAGFVVPYEDAAGMAGRVASLMEDKTLGRRLGEAAHDKLVSRFTPELNIPFVLSACRKATGKMPAVSVIVPNYNHARYLPARLDSIFNQTFRDFEVILLDDSSTDNSIEILERYSGRADVRIVKNEENSGSSFRQWLKGIDLARADIIWIAESDDVSDPRFIETLLPAFGDPEVKLAYTDSIVIDENGVAGPAYSEGEYLASLSEKKWMTSYTVVANREINDGLGVKNTVLNVSSALYRKFDLGEEFREMLTGMRIAGDWLFAVYAIKGGKVHYDARRLNYHRRHSASVVGKVVSAGKLEEFFKEFYHVQKYIFGNYEPDKDFPKKWEDYLRKQWDYFCPGRPFDELKDYYPFDDMKKALSGQMGVG